MTDSIKIHQELYPNPIDEGFPGKQKETKLYY